MKRILVPLDGSELAEVVLVYAKELAARLDLDVILLHIAGQYDQGLMPVHRAYVEHAAEIVKRQSNEVRKKIGAGGGELKVRAEITTGYPPEEILRYAEENSVDFILLATHGRSGVRRWVMGSVADKVLRVSKAPILLVRAGIKEETAYDKWPSKTIVVPLDGSELSEIVLPYVETLAKQRGTEAVNVVLLRVCEPLTIPYYATPDLPGLPLNWGEYVDKEMARCVQEARDYLSKIEKRFKDAGLKVESKILDGKASDEIVNYISKNPLSIVIMASHGRSGVRRLVYGSVAANILSRVSSPIFLVRPH